MSEEEKSRFVAFVFDDPYKAEEARAAFNRMRGEGLLEIAETAIIVKEADGSVSAKQDENKTAEDKHAGHVLGLVTAAITGTMPFILAGTLGGELIGWLTDDGITNKFIKEVENELQPGTSALILLGRSHLKQRPQIVERLKPFGPKLLESDLPPELEQKLSTALDGARKGASGGR